MNTRPRADNSLTGLALLLAGLFLATTCHANPVEEGRSLYHELCASCHGRDMLNPGLAYDLRKFPKEDKKRFVNAVQNGTPKGMPPWKEQLSPEDIDTLWAYVRSGG